MAKQEWPREQRIIVSCKVVCMVQIACIIGLNSRRVSRLSSLIYVRSPRLLHHRVTTLAYSRARAATTPPTRPATPADSRGAGLEVLEGVAAAPEPEAAESAAPADVAALVGAAVAEPVLPVLAAVPLVWLAVAELLVVVAAAAPVPVLPEAVDVQDTTEGRPVTPWAAHSCEAKTTAELWSAGAHPPGAARQQAMSDKKSLSEQMHLASEPQLPMPPVRNLLAQDCYGRCI